MKNDPLKISGMHDGATPNIFKNAFRLRENMTDAEIKLWKYLRTKPMGLKFRRQHPIGGFILDFYCHKLRLSIEIDGGYHLKNEQIKKDEDRTFYLKSVGILEVRFTNKQILDSFNQSVDKIHSLLKSEGIPLGIEGERKGNIL